MPGDLFTASSRVPRPLRVRGDLRCVVGNARLALKSPPMSPPPLSPSPSLPSRSCPHDARPAHRWRGEGAEEGRVTEADTVGKRGEGGETDALAWRTGGATPYRPPSTPRSRDGASLWRFSLAPPLARVPAAPPRPWHTRDGEIPQRHEDAPRAQSPPPLYSTRAHAHAVVVFVSLRVFAAFNAHMGLASFLVLVPLSLCREEVRGRVRARAPLPSARCVSVPLPCSSPSPPSLRACVGGRGRLIEETTKWRAATAPQRCGARGARAGGAEERQRCFSVRAACV